MSSIEDLALPYEILRDDLIGDLSDRAAHLFARTALLEELRSNQQLSECITAAICDTELKFKIRDFVNAKLQLANILGVENQFAAIPSKWPKLRTKKRQREVLDAGNAYLQTVENLNEESVNFAPIFTNAILKLTCDLWGLPFAWLPMELLGEFTIELTNFYLGGETWLSRSLTTTDTVEAFTAPEDSRDNQIEIVKARLEELTRNRPARGTRKPNEEKIRRNVNWFYRNRVLAESKGALAREYHAKEHRHLGSAVCSGDESVIRSGINEAQRLFEVSPHRIG